MKSILLKKALRQRLGIKKGWGTVMIPIEKRTGEEQWTSKKQ